MCVSCLCTHCYGVFVKEHHVVLIGKIVDSCLMRRANSEEVLRRRFWVYSNVATRNVFSMFSPSFLQSSGLFVDRAFPHATACAEEAEADDVQLFHSPDQTREGSALAIAGGKQASSKTLDLSRTNCHVQTHSPFTPSCPPTDFHVSIHLDSKPPPTTTTSHTTHA